MPGHLEKTDRFRGQKRKGLDEHNTNSIHMYRKGKYIS